MSFYEINIALNCITAFILGAASIDSRVHNKTIGAIALSIGCVGSILNMARPDFFGLLPIGMAIGLDSILAMSAIYWRMTWKDQRKNNNRRIFGERRQ